MPHKFEKERTKLPSGKDRRYKLGEVERNHIRELISYGVTIEAAAKMYNVSRATVKMIVDEDYREMVNAKKRGRWRDFYDKKEHARKMREHRQYKKQVLEEYENYN